MGAMLGVLQQDPDSLLEAQRRRPAACRDAEVEALLAARRAARAAKNFAESDRIRELLSAAGILLDDKPGGRTEWRRA